MSADYIERCHVCLGRGRWRGKRCPVCNGAGKLWKPEEESVLEPDPTETDAVVYVLDAHCDNCDYVFAGDSTKPHKATLFKEPRIWCGKCNRGLVTFTLSSEPPRPVEARP